MTPEELKAHVKESLQQAQNTINRWHSHAAITPEINKELSLMTYGITSTVFLTTNFYNDEFNNITKCIIEAAFQYGRRHPITQLNWIVKEDETPL